MQSLTARSTPVFGSKQCSVRSSQRGLKVGRAEAGRGAESGRGWLAAGVHCIGQQQWHGMPGPQCAMPTATPSHQPPLRHRRRRLPRTNCCAPLVCPLPAASGRCHGQEGHPPQMAQRGQGHVQRRGGADHQRHPGQLHGWVATDTARPIFTFAPSPFIVSNGTQLNCSFVLALGTVHVSPGEACWRFLMRTGHPSHAMLHTQPTALYLALMLCLYCSRYLERQPPLLPGSNLYCGD